MSSTSDRIIDLASAALSPSVDISGCPTTVAMLAAPTVLRAAAEGFVAGSAPALALHRWADEIDSRAMTVNAPNASGGGA